jgi:Glycosyl transferase family 2
MAGIRGALRRPDVFDWLSFALIVTVVALALSYWSKFPVHMDTGYHMAVTAGYARAGGIALHSFWEFAPAGRAQLYPPLLHVIMYAFTGLGLSATTTARLVTFAAFPLLLLSGSYGMRKMFSSRSAFYTVVLLASCYLLFWHSAVESAASLVLILTPLIFVAVDRNRKVATAFLLALALYSHLTLGHLVAFGLLIYAIHRREMFKEILIVLVGAYLLWLPWGIQILMHYKSLSFDQGGGAGGITVHLLIWLVALAGFVYCYFKKEKYYLLPSFLLGLVPMVFFYPDRFWNAHVFLPLAMLGGVALSGLHGYLGDKVRLAVKDRNVRRVFVTAMMAVPVVLFLFVDPVYASGGGMGGGPPGAVRQAVGQQGVQAAAQGATQQQLPAQPPGLGTGGPPPQGAPAGSPPGQGEQTGTGTQVGPPALGVAAPGQGVPGGGSPGGGSGLHSTRTTIASLVGSGGAGQQSLSGSSLISSDVLALSKLIEKNSTRDEIVSVQDGSLGNLLTGLTGRPSTSGMFHEVAADSGGATGASSNAALLVVSRGGMGGGQAPATGEQNCVLVIVPCFNEEASIRRVVVELKRCAPFADVLVIDDGSSDRTGEVARAAGAMVLTHPRNQGVGAAMRSGSTYATAQGYLFAVRVDGDGQHDPRYIASLLRPLIGGADDVSIGSRFLGTDGYKPPFARRIGTMVLSSTVSLATGRVTRDTTSGFRAMNRRALNFLIWSYPDEYPEPESLVLMHQNGLRWEEVPVVMRSRSNGTSSIRGLGGGARFVAGALSRIALDLLVARPSPGPARV